MLAFSLGFGFLFLSLRVASIFYNVCYFSTRDDEHLIAKLQLIYFSKAQVLGTLILLSIISN